MILVVHEIILMGGGCIHVLAAELFLYSECKSTSFVVETFYKHYKNLSRKRTEFEVCFLIRNNTIAGATSATFSFIYY